MSNSQADCFVGRNTSRNPEFGDDRFELTDMDNSECKENGLPDEIFSMRFSGQKRKETTKMYMGSASQK